MQEELAVFNRYRKEEKPPKYKEKGDMEALIFSIQTKRTAMRRRPFVPQEGLFLHDLETAWTKLDHAENERQVALIQEIQRQEKLEMKARLFYNKAQVRDAWLRNIINVLTNFECGTTLGDVEKAQQMLSSISTVAGPKANQFKHLSEISSELQRNEYHGTEGVKSREREVIEHWNQFLVMLRNKEQELERFKTLAKLLLDLDTISAELKQLENQMRRNRNVGRHLLALEDLLQKHELLETSIATNGEWLKRVRRQSVDYIRSGGEHFETLQVVFKSICIQFECYPF